MHRATAWTCFGLVLVFLGCGSQKDTANDPSQGIGSEEQRLGVSGRLAQIAERLQALPKKEWSDKFEADVPQISSKQHDQVSQASTSDLVALLASENLRIRAAAARRLASTIEHEAAQSIDSETAVSNLTANLAAPWPEARIAAAQCLQQLPGSEPETLEALVLLLRDGPSVAERAEAALAISLMGEISDAARSILEERVEAEPRSPEPEARIIFEALFTALARLNDQTTVNRLTVGEEAIPGDELRQECAITALGNISDANIYIVRRINAFADTEMPMRLRRTAVRALAGLQPQSDVALYFLGVQLDDEDAEFRRFVSNVVREIPLDSPELMASFRKGLQDDDTYIALVLESSALDDKSIVKLALEVCAAERGSNGATNYVLVDDSLDRVNLLIEITNDPSEADATRGWAAYSLVNTYWRYARMAGGAKRRSEESHRVMQLQFNHWAQGNTLPAAASEVIRLADGNLFDALQRADVAKLLVESNSPAVRELAARLIYWAMVTADDAQLFPDLIDALTSALSDTESDAAYYSAQSLSRFGESARGALPALVDAMANPEFPYRDTFRDIIVEIGDPEGLSAPVLLAEINKERKFGTFPPIHYAAALGKILAANDALLDRHEAELREMLGASDEAQHNARLCLKSLGPKAERFLDVIVAPLEDPSFEGTRAAEDAIPLIGNIGAQPERFVPMLASYLDNSDKDSDLLRNEAIQALGRFGESAKEHIQQIMEFVDEGDRMFGPMSYVLSSLESFGPVAQEYGPELRAIWPRMQDTRLPTRFQFGSTLYAIDGQSPESKSIALEAMFGPTTNDSFDVLDEARGQFGERAATLVTEAMFHDDANVRDFAGRYFSELTNEELASGLVPVCIEVVHDSNDQEARWRAVKLLVDHEFANEHLDVLASLLDDESLETRALVAAEMLQAGRDIDVVVPIIADAAAASVGGSVWTYSDLLSRYPNTTGARLVEILLDPDTDETSRGNAAYLLAMAEQVPQTTFSELISEFSSSSSDLAPFAAVVLSNFRDGRDDAVAHGIDLIKPLQIASESESALVRAAAISGIELMGEYPEEINQRLWELMQDPHPDIPFWAADAIEVSPLSENDAIRFGELLAEEATLDLALAGLDERSEEFAVDAATQLLPALRNAMAFTQPDSDECSVLLELMNRCGPGGRQALLEIITDSDTPPARQYRGMIVLEDSDLTEQDLEAIASLMSEPIENQHLALHAAIVFAVRDLPHELASQILLQHLVTGDNLDVTESLAAQANWTHRDQAELETRALALFDRRHELQSYEFVESLPAICEDKHALTSAILSAIAAAGPAESMQELFAAIRKLAKGATSGIEVALASDDDAMKLAAARVMLHLENSTAVDFLAAVRSSLESEVAGSKQHRELLIVLARHATEEVIDSASILEALPRRGDDPLHARYHNLDAKIAAIGNLEENGSAATPRLLRILSVTDEFDDVCYEALGKIGKGSEEVAGHIKTRLVRLEKVTNVCRVLTKESTAMDACSPMLLQMLQDEGRMQAAAYALGRGGNISQQQEAVEILLAQFDQDVLRSDAIRAVGRLGSAAAPAFDRIASAASSGNTQEMTAALFAIGKLHEHFPGAVAHLEGALDNQRMCPVALRVLQDLGESAAPAVPKLRELLASDEFRQEAVNVLAAIGKNAKDAVEDLRNLRQSLGESADDDSLRVAIDHALSKMQ